MAVVIACPTCQQKVRIGENLLGKQVKCPQCKNPFTAVDPNAVPSPTWEAVTSQPEPDYGPPPEEPRRQDDFNYDNEGPPRTFEPPPKSGGNKFLDYLLFRRMVTPWVIIVLYYIGVVVLLISGLVWGIGSIVGLVVSGSWLGILTLFGAFFGTILGIVVLRIYCEVLVVLFRILDNLREINEKLDKD